MLVKHTDIIEMEREKKIIQILDATCSLLLQVYGGEMKR